MKINNERKTNTGGGRLSEREGVSAESEVSWRSRWRHNFNANLQECLKGGAEAEGVQGVLWGLWYHSRHYHYPATETARETETGQNSHMHTLIRVCVYTIVHLAFLWHCTGDETTENYYI